MKNPFTRRGCLSAFLGLIILVNFLFAMYLLLALSGALGPVTMQPKVILLSAAICLANAACAVGVWFWRRWGVIGYGVLAVLSYITNAVMTGNFANIIGLAGSSILVALVLPYWKDMK